MPELLMLDPLYRDSGQNTLIYIIVISYTRKLVIRYAITQRQKTIETKEYVDDERWNEVNDSLYGVVEFLTGIIQIPQIIRTGEYNYWFSYGEKMYSIMETIKVIRPMSNRTLEEQLAQVATDYHIQKIEQEGYLMDSGNDDKIPHVMCAKVYAIKLETEKKIYRDITYPIMAQRKYDGIRCRVFADMSGNLRLISRRNKSLDHLFVHMKGFKAELITLMSEFRNMVLDGELYIHGLSLQYISGACRSLEKKDIHKELKYYVFTHCDRKTASDRYNELKTVFNKYDFKKIVLAHIWTVDNEEELDQRLDKEIERGYEGLMLYVPDAPYDAKTVNHRSNYLLKYKKFLDMEVIIIDIETENTTHTDKRGLFMCEGENDDGIKYIIRIRPIGTIEERVHIYTNPDKYIGRTITIKYSHLTADNLPAHPTMKCFKDEVL